METPETVNEAAVVAAKVVAPDTARVEVRVVAPDTARVELRVVAPETPSVVTVVPGERLLGLLRLFFLTKRGNSGAW